MNCIPGQHETVGFSGYVNGIMEKKRDSYAGIF
jgi:hypothetical protein